MTINQEAEQNQKSEILPGQDILGLLATAGIPEMQWDIEDDLCDCTFPRAGFWTNPYIARTLKVRLCCIWAELHKMFPQHIQEIPAFTDYRINNNTYAAEPWEWNGEAPMPRYLWYRQLAVQTGFSLAQVRELYEDQQPPEGTPKAAEESTEISEPSQSLGPTISLNQLYGLLGQKEAELAALRIENAQLKSILQQVTEPTLTGESIG